MSGPVGIAAHGSYGGRQPGAGTAGRTTIYTLTNMSNTTTIEITTEQKAALDERKRTDSESYKSVLQRLIDSHSTTTELTETRVRELAREEINQLVTVRALE